MGTPELHRANQLPDFEPANPWMSGRAFKKVLVAVAGGSEPFFPETPQDPTQLIDWDQAPELTDLRAEWAEQARLESLRTDQWFARMELGRTDDDVALTAEVRVPSSDIDVPSFLRPWPASSDVKNSEQLTGFVRTPWPEEPVRENKIAPLAPAKVETTKDKQSESPERVEYVLDMTRIEVIANVAERLAKPNGRLLHHLAVKTAIDKDPRHRSLLQDKDFIGLLKNYGAGREGFVALVYESIKHPKYQSVVLQSPARATYLKEHNAADLVLVNVDEEVSHETIA